MLWKSEVRVVFLVVGELRSVGSLTCQTTGKAFTSALERLVEDRTTNPKVKKRAIECIAMWVRMMDDPGSELSDAGGSALMGELAEKLRAGGHNLTPPPSPPPPQVDDEIRRREEDELQRVLELSMQETRYQDTDHSRAAAYSTGYTPGAAAASSSTAAATSNALAYDNSPSQESPPQTPIDELRSPMNFVTRVRALHTFESTESGELGFTKGTLLVL